MANEKGMRDKVKSLWIRGMKAIGNTAASIANNTRYKVDEVTIQNRRREVMNDLAVKAYALWLKGEPFPEPMAKMLEELKLLDEQLNDIRAEKYASGRKAQKAESKPEEDGEEDPGSADEEAEEEEEPLIIPTANTPVSTEINGLFDGTPSVGQAAEKVNSTLHSMSDRISSFPKGGENGEKDQRQEGPADEGKNSD